MKYRHWFNKRVAVIVSYLSFFLFVHSARCFLCKGLLNSWRKILKCFGLTGFRIISHALYTKAHAGSSVWLVIRNRTGSTSNVVFNQEPRNNSLVSGELPDLYVAEHRNLRIQGDSDLVIDINEHCVINDFCYQMSPRYAYYDGILWSQKDDFALLKYDGKRCDRFIASGIMLSGKFSRNYYHQMYEIMIRLLIVEKTGIPESVPLIADEIVFKIGSFKQLFETLNQTARKIITIGEKEVIGFGSLFCISAVNQIPPHRKRPDDGFITDILYDLSVLLQMRQRLLKLRSERKFPSRIFLSRRNTGNRKYNEPELIALATQYGFNVVVPEDYALFEQIALFNGAEFIIGATGAAFSNLLFCNKDCHIICMQSRAFNSPAFSTLAYFVGADMRYLSGTACGKDIHSDFYINPQSLKDAIEYNINKQ